MPESLSEPRSGQSVGFDFGLKTFLRSSDGNDIWSPLFFKQGLKEFRRQNRSLSRKQKGSHNRQRARADLARAHQKIANRRKNYHFKLAGELADEYAVICVEGLNVKAMQKIWGRKISDLGHGEFVKVLDYQCAKAGSKLVEIPRFYPSSKTCFDCGYVLDELLLRVREWTCPECGIAHDRDLNAAKNIHRVGASTLVG